MDNASDELEWGTILCKHCGSVIGTFYSEKVTIYYSDCQEPDCLQARKNKIEPWIKE
jgi:hypothetical protein